MTISSRLGRSLAPVTVAVLLVLLAGGALAASGGPFTLTAAVPKTLTPDSLASAQKTETRGQVSADSRTLTFTQKTVRLVAETGPEDDMLSYRIGGLRNPMLVVPRAAMIRLLFVNTDDDMFHNVRFGAAQKTYPNAMAAYLKASVGTPELPHKTETALHGEEMTLRVPDAPGAYAYLCTVRGHAQGGMIGKVVVK